VISGNELVGVWPRTDQSGRSDDPVRGCEQRSVKIPRRQRKGATQGAVDSTGLKIFDEGEWAEAGLLD